MVKSWLGEAYPGVAIKARNGCVPATPSAFMELCLEKHMGPDADLVFMEYATNDGPEFADLDNSRTFERLLRKVLDLPSRPAVVFVHLPTKGQAFDASNEFKRRYYESVEDVYGAFASYYQAPALSFRCVGSHAVGVVCTWQKGGGAPGGAAHPSDSPMRPARPVPHQHLRGGNRLLPRTLPPTCSCPSPHTPQCLRACNTHAGMLCGTWRSFTSATATGVTGMAIMTLCTPWRRATRQ